MVDDAHDAATSVFTGQSDVNLGFAGLWVMSHGCRRHLSGLEIDAKLVRKLKFIDIVLE